MYWIASYTNLYEVLSLHIIIDCTSTVLMDNSREDLKLWEILFTTKAGFGWVYDTAILTGWALEIIVVIMIICSMPFVRRSGYFQVMSIFFHYFRK
jgi:hypothetical protein